MDLRALATTQAQAVLGDGPVIPFVLLEGTDGTLTSINVVTQRSDHAFVLARRIVRSHARTSVGYAIAIDAFVRVDDLARMDAILVEAGTREGNAEVVAHTYANGAWSGTPRSYALRPSLLGADADPLGWRWTASTPDRYNPSTNTAAHIINHAIEADDDIDRVVRFLRGRAAMFDRHLPKKPPLTQILFAEDRGMDLGDESRERLVSGVDGVMASVRWLSEVN